MATFPIRRSYVFVAVFASLIFFVFFFSADIHRQFKPFSVSSRPKEYKQETPTVSESSSSPQRSQATQQRPSTVSTTTTIPGNTHVHGFTLLDDIYLRNGTLYILTSNVSSFPPRRNLISLPQDLGRDDDMEPTDDELQFIHPSKAREVLGEHAIRVEGFTVILYDSPQFMAHLYHWWGEIILGFWRVYSKLANSDDATINPLAFPDRFLLPYIDGNEWRDRAGVDGPLMRAAFSAASIERSDYWHDLFKLDVTIVFDRVMLINRQTAHRHPNAGKWFKMIAGTMDVTVPPNFWDPVRLMIIRNLMGYVPSFNSRGVVISPPQAVSSAPIVTYVSRQGTGRRLIEKDHQDLVATLLELEKEGICEFKIARMERMSLRDQVELASRTTIMIGVHGNGLTHQLWMPHSPVSSTIEIFIPKGYAFDYEILARNMGHRHYGVWNDTVMTYPKGTYHPEVYQPDGFHGSNIPVYAPAIAETVRKRLAEFT